MLTHTFATKFPPYVFSTSPLGCLVHKVKEVRLYWDAGKFSHSVIECFCNQAFGAKRSRTCMMPNEEATKCARCFGTGSGVFKWHGDYERRREAHRKLGCRQLVGEAVSA